MFLLGIFIKCLIYVQHTVQKVVILKKNIFLIYNQIAPNYYENNMLLKMKLFGIRVVYI